MDIQLKYYRDNQKLNGTLLNRLFHHNEYTKELQQIFSHNNIFNEVQIKKFFKLFFDRQRHFGIGPGNSQTPTPYGRYYKLNKEGVVVVKRDKILTSLWDESIGFCSIYPDQPRAPKTSLSSSIFNILNDINNIKIGEQRGLITTKLRMNILKIAMTTKTKASNSKKIWNLLENTFPNTSITGNREDKKGSPEFTCLEHFIIINKILNNKVTIDNLFLEKKSSNGINYSFDNDNIIDNIISILHKTLIKENRIDELKALNKKGHNLTNEQIIQLSTINKSYSQTHSLSYKILRQIVNISINECKNMSEILHDNNVKAEDKNDYGTSYLKSEWVDSCILTPTVKRSLRQTIKVLNSIFNMSHDKHWEISDIVIEMARENNNKRARENKKNSQKYFDNMNKEIINRIEPFNTTISKTLKSKVWLWEQQEHKDAYTGELININDLIKNSHHYDIDHIIPQSQSFENARFNKVLTHHTINAKKSNKTPFYYYKTTTFNNFAKMKSLWSKWYLNLNKSKDKAHLYDKEKYRRLTTEIDFSIRENQLGFIQRNLVDTRYSTKAILNALTQYKNNNNLKFVIKTINGKMTSFARHYMSNSKYNSLMRPDGMYLIDKNGKKAELDVVITRKTHI